ncbi:hypothetical protein TIFTF001_039382 [Ficus carica]|uniref:EF-hand domain-containing protein n=1 Tax=Ficus carica TaxID=3494 RepID=A0AA88JAZ5_FICCA|nr:hypothetical protein TIFTF001_039382 [Ficus carica]
MATDPVSTESNKSMPSLYLQDSDEIKKVFNHFDTNGDGKISVTELGDVLKAPGTEVKPIDLQPVMDELDSDHNGGISLEEFAAFCRQGCDDGGSSELREAFDLYDQDNNGLISTAELHLVLNRLGMKCSVDDCRRMIVSVDGDGDGDGDVNFDEFRKMMTNNVSSHGDGKKA